MSNNELRKICPLMPHNSLLSHFNPEAMIAQTNSIVRVEYVFQASAEEVFDAWLDPAVVPRWMFDPNICEQSIDRISIDPKPGGEFAFRVTRNGRQIEYGGIYLRIERPRLLIFTWMTNGETAKTLIKVTIETLAGGCRLTLLHDLRMKDESGVAAAEALSSSARAIRNRHFPTA